MFHNDRQSEQEKNSKISRSEWLVRRAGGGVVLIGVDVLVCDLHYLQRTNST